VDRPVAAEPESMEEEAAPTAEMLAKWHEEADRCCAKWHADAKSPALCASTILRQPLDSEAAGRAPTGDAAHNCHYHCESETLSPSLATHAISGPTVGFLVRRNLDAAQAAVAATAAAGKPLRLADLLVEPSWQARLGPEFQKQYFKQLQGFLHSEWHAQSVYPPPGMIFRFDADGQT